jgi:LuxR family maltose regulon positive regulatory protein
MNSMLNIDDAIRYAKLSVSILPENDNSIYLANAYLTLGQLFSGTDRYIQAADVFSKSYKLFYALDLQFLASIAFTNEVLNLSKIGEYTVVIKKCTDMWLITESYLHEVGYTWDLIHLPLGICYYELNKPQLAVEHLEKARKCLNNLELFHMYGLSELYLLKSYYILNDINSIMTLQKACENRFSHIYHPFFKLLFFMFKIYLHKLNKEDIKPIINKIETDALENQYYTYFIIMELLVYLKLNKYSEAISIKNLKEKLLYFEAINNISLVQQTCIYLAEFNYLEENTQELLFYLQKAISLYKKYNLSANFYLSPLKSIEYIKIFDIELYNDIKKKSMINKGLLSPREKEIMKLISLGKTNAEISDELFISVGTIKWHINNIFNKLDVKNRVQAIEKAKKN